MGLKFRIGIIVISLLAAGCIGMQSQLLISKGDAKITDWSNWNENTDEGLQYYIESLQQSPNDAKTLRKVGRLYYLKGDYLQAEKYLQKAVAQKEDYALAWNNLAWTYGKMQKYSKKRDAFSKAIRYRENSSPWDFIGLGGAYYSLQNFELAKDNFFRALNLEDRHKAHANAKKHLAYVLYDEGYPGQAQRYFNEYLKFYKDKHIAYRNIGRFYYLRGELETALENFERAVEIAPDYDAGWNNLGWLYWKKGEYQKMKEMFIKATQLLKKKDNAHYYAGLGAAHYYLGEYQEAEKQFRKAENVIKNDREKRNLYQYWPLLAIQAGDKERARELWSKSPSLGLALNIIKDEGVVIFVPKGNFASLAGVQAGDKIVSIDGKPLVDWGSLKRIQQSLRYGQSLDIVLKRHGERIVKRIVLDYWNYTQKTTKNTSYAKKASEEKQDQRVVDSSPPVIIITAPPTKSKGIARVPSQQKTVMVKGSVKDDNGIFQVTVNGYEANVASDGQFWQKVRLAYGNNQIKVEATDILQNRSEKTVTLHRKTGQLSKTQEDRTDQHVETGSYYALLIAIQEYTYESVTDLDYPLTDSLQLKELLVSEYTFDENNVTVLKNPDRSGIIKSLDLLTEQLGKNDNLLIFYSGHGYWDAKLKQGYWLPADARWGERSGWIANSTVSDYLRGIDTQHSLVISDACFSGSMFKTKNAFMRMNESMRAIYALPSRKAITSGAMETVPDKSVFIEYLLKRLKQNRNKYLDAMTLYTSMREAVINNSPTNQKPLYGAIHRSGDEGGDFIFVHR